jgi:cell division protein FtsX
VTAGWASWILRRTGRRLWRSPLFLAALTAAFAVVAGLGAAASALSRESARAALRLGSNSHIVAYLDPELSAEGAAALVLGFSRLPGVSAARALDGKDALRELGATLRSVGQKEDTLAGIEADFLPRSIEITLLPGPDLGTRAREVAARLQRLAGVSAVDTMTDGLARIAAFSALAGRLGTLFAAVAALAAVALLGGLILRERSHHAALAESLHLLGADPLSMWLPLGLGDALAALVGGAVGLLVGHKVTALALAEQTPSLTGLDGHRLAVGLLLLVALGLLTGRLSLPRPRGVG